MHTIIGITGQKFHGKDSIALILRRRYKYVHVNFAMFLKEACKNIFMLSDDQLHGDAKETPDARWSTTPRKLMQIVGTELFRDRFKELLPECLGNESSLWVKCMKLYLNSHRTPTCFVISDVRFEDEAELIRNLNGKIWKVVRPSIVSKDVHASEVQEIKADKVFTNDGTLLQLEQKVVEELCVFGFKKTPEKGLKLDFLPATLEDVQHITKKAKIDEKTPVDSQSL